VEGTCKPDSVPGFPGGSHSSGIAVADDLKRSTRRRGRAGLNASLFDLAPHGVYPAASVTGSAVGSYPTISPLPGPKTIGGVFSVALSVGSLLPAVSRRAALWSPDFPPRHKAAATARSPPPSMYGDSGTASRAGRVRVGTRQQFGVLTLPRQFLYCSWAGWGR